MPFNYLGRKKPNKFLTLSLSILITLKENKDLDRDHHRGNPAWGGAHMGGLSTGAPRVTHPSLQPYVRVSGTITLSAITLSNMQAAGG